MLTLSLLLTVCCCTLATVAQSVTEECSDAAPFAELFKQIQSDLRHWDKAPITAKMMDDVLLEKDTYWKWRRVGFLWEDGVPYIITNTSWPVGARHHRGLLAAHIMVMAGLAQKFGKSIPDVEFAVSSSDEPTVRLDTRKEGELPPPLLRYCKTDKHAEILVPYIHFDMRHYDENILDHIQDFNRKYPWENKTETLFGRFSQYDRFHHRGVNETYKRGFKGTEICRSGSPNLFYCEARTHFMQWAKRARKKQGQPLDVAPQPRRDMGAHAAYKWLVHLDGQTCSSRLEQLLALGSLVVREVSGYYSFYHHLLAPYKHYVPFWQEYPEEVLGALDWARAHDGEARQIAGNAQQLAAKYLHKQARACYWARLLTELSKRLAYTPGTKGGRTYVQKIPVADWLAGPGRKWVRRYQLEMEV